jgi:uncharacterized repeat protein (TIGR01451 family)
VVCTGTATLTQADVDAGVLVTTATATARNPGNQPVTSAPSAVTLGVGETPPPRLTLQAFVVDSPPYTLGQMVTFQYQLTNESPVPLTNLQVTDEPVAGIGCVPGAPTTVCTGTHTLQASDLDAHGFFTHTAVGAGTAPDGTPVSAPPVTLSLPVGTDIAVAMQVEPPATEPDVVTYVVTATNQGALAATGVQVADVVPAGTTFVAATPAPGTTYDPGTGIWAIGPLARGATVPLRLQVRVTSPTPQPNQARLTALDQVDSDPTNNVAEDQPTFADLVVTTTVNQPAPQVGETVTFTVLVQNRGPQPATGVQLVGDVEAGLTLLTGTPSQGTVTAATREWAIGALAVGATATLLVTARVEEAGPLRTLASVSAADQHDPDLSTNTAGLDLSGQPAADLQVQTTVDQRTPPVGSPVTVTVTVTNAGPTAATGVQLTVPLPAGVQLVTATPSQGTYTAATGVWDVGALALGARGTLVVQVRVTQPGPLLLLATATAQEAADPVPSNDASGVVLNGQAADLQVRTTVDRPTPAVGDRITVTVTVTNAGPSAATGIEVTVNLPAGLSLQTATPAQGTYAAATGLWTVGALASSGGPARATLRLEGIVTRAGTLLVRATATTQAQTDPNPLNNQGTATIQTPGTPLRPPADANIPPEARDDTLATPVTGAVTLAVLANDRDRDGDRLTIVVLTQPPGGTVVMNPDRTLTYTPRPGVVGTETFTYTVSDGRGGTATGTVRFTVALPPVSPAPGSPVVPSPDHPTPGALGLAPPAGRKLVTAAGPLELAWRLVWLNPGNPVALATRVVDPLPPATTYIDGSVTCTAQGQSTVQQCAFEAAQNQIVYTGTLGPDPGVTTEEPALHAVVITFRTTVLPGVTQVTNQALAFWAPLGPTTERAQVDDMGQDPVASGTTFTNHDPTTLTLPGLACIFQQRLVALSPPAFSPDASGGDGGSGDDSAMDAGVDRQLVPLPGTDEVFALATPPDGARVAGTAVTLATLQVPGSGLVVSRTTTVTLANSQPGGPLALVEDPAQKAEGVATQTAAVLVTAPGVVVALTPASLASAETVQLAAVDPVAAPAPLPGAAVAPLVALTLTSGRPAFSGPVWLRLPYPDAEPDGQVDGVAPARPVTALTVWHVAGLQGRWGPVPEARVIPDHQRLEVAITATGLYGVFLAADGRLGSAGTHAQAPVGARSAAAQGSGWQDIGVVTTAPLLLPWNTTTLPDGAYELRVLCATPAAAVAAGPAAGPATAGVGQSPGGSGGGGCSLRPGSGGARAAVLAVLGNLGLPLAVLLALRLWHWRRRWAQH